MGVICHVCGGTFQGAGPGPQWGHDTNECKDTRIAELEAALAPFATYADKRDAQPLRGMDDSVHSIHFGTPWFAEITMEHCRAAKAILSKKGRNAP